MTAEVDATPVEENWHALTPEEVCERLSVGVGSGLSESEAAERLALFDEIAGLAAEPVEPDPTGEPGEVDDGHPEDPSI